MRMMNLLTIITIGVLSINLFAQRKNDPKKVYYTNRHHAIDKPTRGHEAKSCVINGEVFATNDHSDLQKICKNSGGQIISPAKAQRLARKANKVTAICCQNSSNTRSFVMVRGPVKSDSCGEAGTKIRKAQCFDKTAEVLNHFADVQGLPAYEPTPRNEAGASLNQYVTDYENVFRCGADNEERTKTGESIRDGKNFIGKTFRKFTDLFRSNKKYTGQGQSVKHDELGVKLINDYDKGLPVCCQSGSEYKVVANECACYASATKSAPKVVGVSQNTCSGLNETFNNLEELKVHPSHDFLEEQLERFVGERKCDAALKGKLDPSSICKHSDSTKFLLYELNCPKKHKRKKSTMDTTTILCHQEIPGSSEGSPASVDYKALQDTSKCHIAEKF